MGKLNLKEWHKANIEQGEDGIYYCNGKHEKQESCDLIKITVDDIKGIIQQGQDASVEIRDNIREKKKSKLRSEDYCCGKKQDN